MAEFALLRAGYDPYGTADFYSHLLYATVQNLSIDAGLQNEFGVPNGVPAHLQKLWTNVHNVCALSAGLTQTCRRRASTGTRTTRPECHSPDRCGARSHARHAGSLAGGKTAHSTTCG